MNVYINSNSTARSFFLSSFTSTGEYKGIISTENHKQDIFYILYLHDYADYINKLEQENPKEDVDLKGGHRKDDKSGQKAKEFEKLKDID